MEEYITPEEQQEYMAYETPDDVIDNLENGIRALSDIVPATYKGKKILVCGAMIAFDRNNRLSDFLNRMNLEVGNLLLLSEVTAQHRRYTKNKINFPYICTPHLLAKEMIITQMDIPVTEDMKALAGQKKYVQVAVTNLEGRHPLLGRGYALAWVYYAYHYINQLLNILEPQKVILWNKFYAFHMLFDEICKERGIPVKYMEFGCLPGTICIEGLGQQGESEPAVHYMQFRRKYINYSEKKQAQDIILYLKEAGLNRNLQPQNNYNIGGGRRYSVSRKNVLYFGQDDFESGLFPYTDTTRTFHSPIFTSSLAALSYLRLISIRNDWNLLYKPHPLVDAIGVENEELEHIDEEDIVRNVNINTLIDSVDIVITIFSQSAYIALIREKPVVMLGYSQLRGKGCVYEAFSLTEVEKQMQKAIQNGFTVKQRKNFKVHVAQLVKYYLFDDLDNRQKRFGRKLSKLTV